VHLRTFGESEVRINETALNPLPFMQTPSSELYSIVTCTDHSRFSTFCQVSWDNLIIAGGSIVACIHNANIRMSSWDASNINVFIVGLDIASAQARVLRFVEKIETGLRRLGMKKYTIYQTRNTITLDFPENPSNRPDIELVMRRVQVILRLYGDIGEVLTGFDVDCCYFAFDGKRVWGTGGGWRPLVWG
jgi:hypothetical protein